MEHPLSLRAACSTFLTLLCLDGFDAPSRADTQPLEIDIGIGLAYPFGEFSDFADPGLLFNPRIGISVRPQWVIGFEYGYYDFADAASDNEAANEAPSFAFNQFTAFSKFLFRAKPTSAYVRVHLGAYQRVPEIYGDIAGIPEAKRDTNLGLGAGGGYQLRGRGRWGGYIDGIFHIAFHPDVTTTVFSVQGGISVLFGARP